MECKHGAHILTIWRKRKNLFDAADAWLWIYVCQRRNDMRLESILKVNWIMQYRHENDPVTGTRAWKVVLVFCVHFFPYLVKLLLSYFLGKKLCAEMLSDKNDHFILIIWIKTYWISSLFFLESFFDVHCLFCIRFSCNQKIYGFLLQIGPFIAWKNISLFLRTIAYIEIELFQPFAM